MMPDGFQCPNLEEHRRHEWVVNVDVSCSGRTECGILSHNPHDYTVQSEEVCIGVAPMSEFVDETLIVSWVFPLFGSPFKIQDDYVPTFREKLFGRKAK